MGLFLGAAHVLRWFLTFLSVGNLQGCSEIKQNFLSMGSCWGRQGHPREQQHSAGTAAPGNAQTGFPLRATPYASEFLEISSSVFPLSIYWMSSFFPFYFFFKASSSKFFALLFPRGSCLHLAGRELAWLNIDLGEVKPQGFQSSLYLSLLLKILFLSAFPM